eukprot:gene7860-5487_t
MHKWSEISSAVKILRIPSLLYPTTDAVSFTWILFVHLSIRVADHIPVSILKAQNVYHDIYLYIYIYIYIYIYCFPYRVRRCEKKISVAALSEELCKETHSRSFRL